MVAPESTHHAQAAQASGHEPEAVPARAVFWWSVGLVGLVGLALVLAAALAQFLLTPEPARRDALPNLEVQTVPTEPQLQPRPARELQTLRAAEDEVLETYGWVDRQQGLARIPIDRAMELLAEKGLPMASE